MKNKFLLIIIFSISLISCAKYDSIEEIDYSNINEKINNKESFIYYLGREDCSYCLKLANNLNSIKDIKVYYIDIDKISDNSYDNELEKLNNIIPSSYFNDNGYLLHLKAIYTPSILKYIDGKLITCYVGNQSRYELIDILDYNFVDLKYYSNYLNNINITNSKILFYNDSSKSAKKEINNIKKSAIENNDIIYYLKYSSLNNSEMNDLLDYYNNINNTNLNSLKEIDYFYK